MLISTNKRYLPFKLKLNKMRHGDFKAFKWREIIINSIQNDVEKTSNELKMISHKITANTHQNL
jgi:hypothetical protein